MICPMTYVREDKAGASLVISTQNPVTSARGATPSRRILFHMLGDARKASSRVRGYWIADELEAMGHHVSFMDATRRADFWQLFVAGLKSDAIIFQKRYARYDVWIAHILRRLGKTVIFDIDDAPSNTGNPVAERNAARMMRAAHRVLAGSHNLEALARAEGGEAVFIPSGIRLENYVLGATHNDGPVCLGWIGNGAHYVDDLVSVLEQPLKNIAAQCPVKLKIVGACGQERLRAVFGSIAGLELELIDQIDWARPEAVAEAVAAFDIGLYPLLESDFNRYKCAFKALEYMATGLPVVASAVGANGDVITDGRDGLLVNTHEAWTEALMRLIGDPDLRRKMGHAGRTKVETRYNTAALATEIAELLE